MCDSQKLCSWPKGSILALLLLACSGAAALASPLDALIKFYTSSVPNPPKIDIDEVQVRRLVETGDIIIENNRAFPQWYAVIGGLVPACRFVHAGVVVKGHVLKQLIQELRPTDSVITTQAYYRVGLPKIENNKVKRVFNWLPYPIDPHGTYVITPEVTINTTISRVVALNLVNYLCDPAIGYPTKHIRIIRPRLGSQQMVRALAKYLAYHVWKGTTYDMGFDLSEKEDAIVRQRDGELWFDLTANPVPLYCTELVWRGLREAGLQVPTTQIRRGLAGLVGRIPRMPRSVVQKLDAAFVTADLLEQAGTVIYQNEPPPPVREALGRMVDLNFKAVCQKLWNHIQTLVNGQR
ncbi:MAG: hypothetical protein OZSIB_2845 [Candidatus Ozemobacter sibiricus]|jgi:hypothetical protein|uniref:Uncharacterized protein n=1 Tax=Candidatus Ozemobacter sibiricus TaxID=2268124 RepID=A0A367ZIV2_9BACT|nr:MAG: hypothetical protein OZSIB_2845 [Candidatus Ozemobacter sibiricus]